MFGASSAVYVLCYVRLLFMLYVDLYMSTINSQTHVFQLKSSFVGSKCMFFSQWYNFFLDLCTKLCSLGARLWSTIAHCLVVIIVWFLKRDRVIWWRYPTEVKETKLYHHLQAVNKVTRLFNLLDQSLATVSLMNEKKRFFWEVMCWSYCTCFYWGENTL
jgi:hypothetical protein